MKQKLVTYFDCESTSGRASTACCLSVSYITCDINNNFKIINSLSGTINSRFKNSRPFEVDAMLAHNIPIDKIENEKNSNAELVDKWDKAFRELSDMGSIFCGFNNFNYDNILLNNSLFINLKFPFIINKEQWDLLPAIRAASVFAPGSLNYELNAKGNTSYKLQSMLRANNIIPKKEHDSYEDTLSTLKLSKLLKDKAPQIFDAALALRRKTDVLPKIKKEEIFCWHESYFRTRIFCGTFLGDTIFPGWFNLFDLRKNPEEILSLNIQDLKSDLSNSKIKYIRTLKSNRAPIILDKKFSTLDDDYKELGMKEIKRRFNLIKNNKEELSSKIKLIQEEKYNDKQEINQDKLRPEERIYTLNITPKERNLANNFNLNPNPKEKKKIFDEFERDEVKLLAKMRVFDNFEEREFCEIFSRREYKSLKKEIADLILDTSNSPSPFSKIPEQQARIDTLRVIAEKSEDEFKINQLNSFDRYLEDMKNKFLQVY